MLRPDVPTWVHHSLPSIWQECSWLRTGWLTWYVWHTDAMPSWEEIKHQQGENTPCTHIYTPYGHAQPHTTLTNIDIQCSSHHSRRYCLWLCGGVKSLAAAGGLQQQPGFFTIWPPASHQPTAHCCDLICKICSITHMFTLAGTHRI